MKRPVLVATSRTVLLAAVIAAAGLSGCSTLSKLNFLKTSTNKSIASKGERIPIQASEDQLAQTPALKGQSFFLPDAQPQADWPLPGGTPEQSVEHVEAAPDFRVAWRRNLGMSGVPRPHFVTAPPIEADGLVYTMDAQAQVEGHDARTGARRWTNNMQSHERRDRDAFGGGLAYADGKVFVSSGYRFVAALDSHTGKVLWKTSTDAPIHAAPTVSNGRVFVVSLDDQLYTFDANTGEPGWNYQAIIEPARMLEASSPAISGDSVITTFASGEVIAKRAANGNDLWNQALSRSNRNSALSEIRDIAGRPVVYKGDVYAASHSGVFSAIDLRTGTPRWTLPVASFTTPWAAGDVVYIVSQTGQLVCVSRESGGIYWIVDMNAAELVGKGRRKKVNKKKQNAYWSGPVLASGRLILVSSKGEMESRDPKTGDLLSTLRIGSPMMIPPIAAGGMLYVVTEKAELVAIR
jgi:outer membrane protein assembly factor BamB